MSRFVEVQNNIIVGHFSGEQPDGPEYQQIPEDLVFSIGDDRRNWDAAWNLRPRADRVAEGLLEIPNGQKLVDGMFLPKTLAEQLADGEVVRPSGMMIDAEGLRWRPASLGEQVALGDLQLDQLKQILRDQVEAAIPRFRKSGFAYGGMVYQADQGVSEAVNGVLTALASGVPVGFPLPWRSGDNQRPAWASQEVFVGFAAALLAFINNLYQRAWDTKDAIAAATTAEEAGAAFDAGGWGTE